MKSVFFCYLKNNKKDFLVLIILFFIGIIGGIAFINNANEIQIEEKNIEVLNRTIMQMKIRRG